MSAKHGSALQVTINGPELHLRNFCGGSAAERAYGRSCRPSTGLLEKSRNRETLELLLRLGGLRTPRAHRAMFRGDKIFRKTARSCMWPSRTGGHPSSWMAEKSCRKSRRAGQDGEVSRIGLEAGVEGDTGKRIATSQHRLGGPTWSGMAYETLTLSASRRFGCFQSNSPTWPKRSGFERRRLFTSLKTFTTRET